MLLDYAWTSWKMRHEGNFNPKADFTKGEAMNVGLTNDGPVTIIIDTKARE